MNGKRKTQRQSGLLQLGQTARLPDANVMLIIIQEIEDDRKMWE
jgi:hypothetical protein